MLIVQETVTFQVGPQYVPKIMAILQSGALDLKNEKATLHFDSVGNLRLIEYPHKFTPNLTES